MVVPPGLCHPGPGVLPGPGGHPPEPGDEVLHRDQHHLSPPDPYRGLVRHERPDAGVPVEVGIPVGGPPLCGGGGGMHRLFSEKQMVLTRAHSNVFGEIDNLTLLSDKLRKIS